MYLNGFAYTEGRGFGEDKVSKAGAFHMIDAQVNPSHSLQSRCHVGPHASHRFRNQRRYSAV